MPKLVLTILALAALALGAGSANAAAIYTNHWESPSGNIHCAFNGRTAALTCATASPRRSITLWADGTTSRGRGLPSSRGVVMPYGWTWTSYRGYGDTFCFSTRSGMDCTNGWGSIHVSREAVYANPTTGYDY